MKSKLLLVCDCVDRYFFFRRFYSEGIYDIHFVTTEPLIYFIARLQGFKVTLTSLPILNKDEIEDIDVDNSLEVMVGGFEKKYAKNLLITYVEDLKVLREKYYFSYVIAWNGQHLLGLSATKVFQEKVIYLELSNLPNKLFVGRGGVNAYSSLFFNPSQLDSLPEPTNTFHLKWLSQYEGYKRLPPPQSQVSSMQLCIRAANTLVTAMRGFSSIKNFLFRIANFKGKPVDFTSYGLSEESLDVCYVLCPLQVSTDTQLMLHSDFDNLSLIKKAHELAQNKNMKLYVKFHPAEKSISEVQKIIGLQKEIGFSIVSTNTNELIKNANTVVVNNSTVGLESLIYQKEVHIFGRAIYTSFDEARLKKYIHSYLLDNIDYFGKARINVSDLITKFESLK